MIIQVIGSTGMLGSAVLESIVNKNIFVYTSPVRLNSITSSDIRGDIVINCAGLVKQVKAFDHDFIRVNALNVHLLAYACSVSGSKLIHISTDCVFNRNGPHFENDIPDATDIYAISKRAGEIISNKHLTIRTSFIGSSGKRGLVADLLNGSVNASARFFWSGHTVRTIADLLVDIAVNREDITGLLHVPGEFQSRLDLCYAICNQLNLSTDRIIKDDSFVADRRLVSSRWSLLGLPILPPFREQLKTL